ncbi:bifunctional 3'-5' exonuclease/DNA polymerase [Pseudactinotalea sp. HY158]|uniref:bifunctional 3'-5' exonuclease/DNA polymerase n=1 Tax=Pseudactinotalea sp. HY158 TaxID=2654547 RepID=UPI0018925DFD|nr:bifunctional 3'-5' exonuclease/DNA polymerase [Pseudactinotalea sp. HY158]
MEIYLTGDANEDVVELAVGDGPVHTAPPEELHTLLPDPADPADPAGRAGRAGRAGTGGAGDIVWVWADTARAYGPALHRLGCVRRCHDLRAVERLLRSVDSSGGADSADSSGRADALPTTPPWLDVSHHPPHTPDPAPRGLFSTQSATPTVAELRARYALHARVLESASPGLRLLAAAESAGALVAAEIYAAGLPWDVGRHREILEQTLGPRPAAGRRPAVMAGLTEEIRAALHAPRLNPDSPAALLRALQAAGVPVQSTSKWELRALDPALHPVVTPLLAYKRLARLLAANGWAWLDEWIVPPEHTRLRGRFRPDYLPSAVVTGRWAAHGGGAMQIPKSIRGAVAAEPGWSLVVADAAQIEPRVLAAMSHDRALAAAGDGRDLYTGLVASGLTDSRERAKVGMLGALYGSTTGTSAELMPLLRRAYPRAMALVDDAARIGERGGRVSTHLGRRSPAHVGGPPADPRAARAWGRFTRNFVVQGSAAEWAVAWMARLRLALRDLDGPAPASPSSLSSPRSPSSPSDSARPELVYFLHDEIIVHCPTDRVGQVREAIEAAAAEAGRLLFGSFPITFPLTVAAGSRYDETLERPGPSGHI